MLKSEDNESYTFTKMIVTDQVQFTKRYYRVHLIQILQIVSFQDVGQDIGSFPNVNHPVRLIGEIFGAKLNVARVRCTVHTACWAEGGVVMERVGNHEGVANSQGEGKARRVGRREDGQENDQRLQEATNRG